MEIVTGIKGAIGIILKRLGDERGDAVSVE